MEMTLDQRRAVAMAAARLRLQEQAPEGRSFGDSFTRQLGLTARAGGPLAVGAAAGAAMGAPIGGVGAIPGAAAGTVAMSILQLVDSLGGTNLIEQAMDKLGLPKPDSAMERVAQGTAQTMAGGVGLTRAAGEMAKQATSKVKPWLEMLAVRPDIALQAATGGGLSGATAKEAGAGPMGQTVANLAGGIAGPMSVAGVKALGNTVGDVGATVGAAFGSKRGAERLAADVVNRAVGDQREQIGNALRTAETFVPGAKPTVAEAVAGAQQWKPEQFGGALIRLQKDLSGAKGVEDILPSAVRTQNKAIETHLASVKEQAKPLREEALRLANQGAWFGRPLKAETITSKIDVELAKPGLRASDVVTKSMGAVKEKIASLADERGIVDADDLYTVRKEVGNTISRFAKETANWDKRLSARLERDIQKNIDDAIEASGGSLWKQYLKLYSEGMKAVEKHELRAGEAKRIAAGVKGQGAADIVAGELPKPPTLLHRPMMAVNFGLRMIARDANTPVAKELATRMQDPDQFLQLMARPKSDPLRAQAVNMARMAGLIGAMRMPPPEDQ